MNLAWKLFISYMVVVIVGALVLALSTAVVAPQTFSRHMVEMRQMMDGTMSDGMAAAMLQLNADLDANFRQAVNSSLVTASVAATVAAGIVSWYVSQRIVRPIRAMATASRRIAAGHYDERLPVRSNDELGQLTLSYNQMAQALADTEKMRQQLIADVSHELKTPLTGIKGYMQGLRDGVIAPTSEAFQQIQREADRLQRLVRDLQELSRSESTRLDLSLHPGSAKSLVESTADFLRQQFVDKNVQLIVDVPAEIPEIRIDPDRIRQVLLNLLGNALQYTPPGGSVTVCLRRSRSQLEFIVRDTGIGLEAADLNRIFQRFYRVDKSRSRASGGSGIGLTIARHIVTAHGGEIWAESRGPGQGSAFHFTLPVA